jgi:hypothetical protein
MVRWAPAFMISSQVYDTAHKVISDQYYHHSYHETYVRVLRFDLYFIIATIQIMASTSNSTPVDTKGRDTVTA